MNGCFRVHRGHSNAVNWDNLRGCFRPNTAISMQRFVGRWRSSGKIPRGRCAGLRMAIPVRRRRRSTSEQSSTKYLRLARDFVTLVELPNEMRSTGFAFEEQVEDKW